MPGPRLTAKQRAALQFIETGGFAAADIPELCQVQGGYGNEAEFLMRLMDRGWVQLVLTNEGRKALES